MILITDPSPTTDILFRSTTDRLASHCRSPVVSGSYLNWKRLLRKLATCTHTIGPGSLRPTALCDEWPSHCCDRVCRRYSENVRLGVHGFVIALSKHPA